MLEEAVAQQQHTVIMASKAAMKESTEVRIEHAKREQSLSTRKEALWAKVLVP